MLSFENSASADDGGAGGEDCLGSKSESDSGSDRLGRRVISPSEIRALHDSLRWGFEITSVHTPIEPQSYVIGWRHVHGDDQSAKVIARDQNLFSSFFSHNANIYLGLKQVVERFGADRVQLAIEHLGDSTKWTEDVRSYCILAERMVEEATARAKDPVSAQAELARLYRGFIQDPTTIIQGFSAEAMLVGYFIKKGMERNIIDGVPPNHTFFSDKLYDLLHAAASQPENPSEAELSEMISTLRQARSSDHRARHEWIRNQVDRIDRPEQVFCVLIGGEHFKTGVRLNSLAAPGFMIEDVLNKPDRQLDVLEDRNLPAVLNGLRGIHRDIATVIPSTLAAWINRTRNNLR